MKRVASDCVGVVWEGFEDGAVFEADSGSLDMTGSSGEIAAKAGDAAEVKFSLAIAGSDKPDI